MMMGPEPRTRIFEMSVRLGIYAVLLLNSSKHIFEPSSLLAGARQAPRASPLPLLHHPRELLEQIMRVMWPGRGFRVILDGEQRQIPVSHSFQSRVIQIHVREFDFTVRQRVRIDGKIMVVRRDFNLASGQLLHWMVPAMMAKLQLEGLATECDTGELMTQTDPENRLPSHQSADRIDRIRTRLGIARPVRQEHSV